MSLSQAGSARVARLSLMAAIGVVAIHTNGLRVLSPLVKKGEADVVVVMTHFVEWFLGSALAGAAVPFFFLVSGYFLAQHSEEVGWYRKALQKRVSTLLVPFICWCFLGWVNDCALSFFANLVANRPLTENMVNVFQAFGVNVFRYPSLRSLWFLRSLFLFVVCSGLFFPLLRRIGFHLGLLIAFLCGVGAKIFLACLGIDTESGDSGWFIFAVTFQLRGWTYFLVGALLAIYHINVERKISLQAKAYLISLAVSCMALRYISEYICPVVNYGILYELTNVTVLVAMWFIVSSRALPVVLASVSFPIYATHLLFVDGGGNLGVDSVFRARDVFVFLGPAMYGRGRWHFDEVHVEQVLFKVG